MVIDTTTEQSNASVFFDKCPIGCRSRLIKSDIILPECTLLRCSVCGQLLSNANEELYDTTMKRFNDLHQINTSPRVHLKRLSRVQHYWKHPPSDTLIVDVGSSFGIFLKVLREEGFKAEGVEPSKEAALACREDRLIVHCGTLEEIAFREKSVDIITLYEVIEHLRNPRSLLEECFRILKNGGRMFISTGNADSITARNLKGKWDYLSMLDGGQGHISFFNPSSIEILTTAIGFKVVAIETKRIKLVNKKYHGGLRYLAGKILQEVLNPVVKIINKGHDMLVVLEK